MRIIKKYWATDPFINRSAIKVYAITGGLAYVFWCFIFLRINPSYHDSFFERALVLWPIDLIVFTADIWKLSDKRTKQIFFFTTLIAVAHHHYMTFMNDYDGFYVAGTMLTITAVFFLESAPRGILIVSTLALSCVALSAFMKPDPRVLFWFAADITAISFGFLGFYTRLLMNDRLEDRKLMVELSLRQLQEKSQELETQRAKTVQSGKLVALGEMASGIAHEINNPLAIIRGYADSIELAIEDNQPELIPARVHKIRITIERITKIISGLRNFASGGEGAPFEKVSAKDFINGILDLSKARFTSGQIEFRLSEIDPETELWIQNIQLAQVIVNLLNNAYDAAMTFKKDFPDRTAWVELSVQDKSEYVEFWITDCGNGIADSVLQKMFQPFFTTKEVGKGTGLGLSISLGIVAHHKGKLFVDQDSPNTRFVVKLPKDPRSMKTNNSQSVA